MRGGACAMERSTLTFVAAWKEEKPDAYYSHT